ncbi:pyruvate dehydrogenase E1 component alpha subunit [Mycobacterium sp. OAE908]|uniref:thiamine pyrophosphate-dependent dehydrogenase E1 component subunit alpha n=1 Tax=Mycobacterium sp. OAE908 TaxID=2817899 RepID=UPI0034E2A025
MANSVNQDPPPEVLRRMFEIMTEIKQTDDRFRVLLSSGQIRCTYYSPRGQEVISAAFGAVLRLDDYVVTTYRGLHDHLAKGVSQRELWAEFLGRSTGTCKGKGGPMHITDPKTGLMVTTGIVGSGIPIANGLALASTLKGTDQVTIVNFGDGASNIGAFHEALNLAAVWKLPVVFVCQNNRYAEHTRYEDGTSVARISDRAASYGMPGETVDGNDGPQMYGAALRAVTRARTGGGPTLVEALTYRFWGHIFGPDDMAYMPTEERAAAMANDPVPRFRALLVEQGTATEEELAAIEASVEKRIDDAVDFALASPPPDMNELLVDVYTEAVTA